MASSPPHEDKDKANAHSAFVHEIAIKLSRSLNTINPNDLLARRVIDIANSNSVDGFTQGLCSILSFTGTNTLFPCRQQAAATFGKFKASFLSELHSDILAHLKQEASGLIPKPVVGMGIVVHDSEVLAPEPVRKGGLVRNDNVSQLIQAI